MMPQRHPREQIVEKARLDLMDKLIDWNREHPDLTYGEYFSIIGDVLGGRVTSSAKYLIRQERHGDEDKPGGWA